MFMRFSCVGQAFTQNIEFACLHSINAGNNVHPQKIEKRNWWQQAFINNIFPRPEGVLGKNSLPFCS